MEVKKTLMASFRNTKMRTLNTYRLTLLSTLFLVISVIVPQMIFGQNGAEVFKKNCAACHTVGGGDLVGPDLNGITSLRSNEWLEKWILSSQDLVNSGDKEAVAIFEEFNSIPMPDQNLSSEELKAVIQYMKENSTSGGEVTTTKTPKTPMKSTDEATEEEILLGQRLFDGEKRLTNKGASCISCHNVNTDRIIPGGLLAKDLTTVYKRMGGDAGISGILNAPPFPAMTESYKDRPITEEEIYAITAFLNKVEKENETHPVESISPLLLWGGGGLIVWIVIILLVWRKRKKYTVKKKIFERQITSH